MPVHERQRAAHLARPTDGRSCRSSSATAAPTLGVRPKRRISSAARIVISAICSARRVGVDVGVGDEHGAVGHHQRVHRRVGLDAAAQPDHLVDVVPVQVVRAEGAAQHAVGVAAVDHHRADQRVAAAHLELRVRLRDATALGQPVVLLPVVAVAVVVLGIDRVEVRAGLEPQAEALDPLLPARPAARPGSAARALRRRRPAPRAARARPRLRRRRCACGASFAPAKIGFIRRPEW